MRSSASESSSIKFANVAFLHLSKEIIYFSSNLSKPFFNAIMGKRPYFLHLHGRRLIVPFRKFNVVNVTEQSMRRLCYASGGILSRIKFHQMHYQKSRDVFFSHVHSFILTKSILAVKIAEIAIKFDSTYAFDNTPLLAIPTLH